MACFAGANALINDVYEQVVFTDHSLFGFADMASILMNKVGTSYRHRLLPLVKGDNLCSP